MKNFETFYVIIIEVGAVPGTVDEARWKVELDARKEIGKRKTERFASQVTIYSHSDGRWLERLAMERLLMSLWFLERKARLLGLDTIVI